MVTPNTALAAVTCAGDLPLLICRRSISDPWLSTVKKAKRKTKFIVCDGRLMSEVRD